jgi:DUF1365 family protein
MILKTHALCKGKVWHKRYKPKMHEFQYNLNMWLVDLQKLSSISNYSWKLNRSGFALYKFINKRYLKGSLVGKSDTNLLMKLREKFIALDAVIESDMEFFFLGQLNNLGLYFSPLNLYLCYKVEKLQYILAEVSNTPWNERHYYLVNLDNLDNFTPKEFHVSPFLNMNLLYKWHFNVNCETICFGIDIHDSDSEGIVFKAEYSGSFINIDDKRFGKEVVTNPLNVYKIIFGIYLEAMFLFIKRIPFVPYKKAKNV